MYKHKETRDDSRFRRPAAPAPQQAWEEPVYNARPMDESEDPYPEIPYEEIPQAEYYDEEEPVLPPEIIATNSTIKLTCTLAAFCSLLALFFFFADKRSRAIRLCAVQSLSIALLHVAGGAVLLLLGNVVGAIPFLGFLVTLLCWLVYIALVVVCVIFRVRLMSAAYQGVKFEVPVVGAWLERRLDRR